MDKPLISIILPAYNSENFIQLALNSIIDQSYPYWEAIIIDDGSTDKTQEIVNNYIVNDDRFKLIVNDINMGGAVSRNIAIQNSNGNYIAFLDSDDYWLNEKLEEQIKFMLTNKFSCSFTSYWRITNSKKTMESTIEKVTYQQMLRLPAFATSTVMVKREIICAKVFKDITNFHDLTLWLAILKDGNIFYGLKIPLTNYKVRQGSISYNKFKAPYWIWNIYRNIEKLPFLLSLNYVIYYTINRIIRTARR